MGFYGAGHGHMSDILLFEDLQGSKSENESGAKHFFLFFFFRLKS